MGRALDLQFGQATATLQGNPVNEPRPGIYRNIFQAYGTYVVPVGSGLTVDFGKWASSLGIEGNYTKYQINYSRSYWFNFLPFYHMGIRANYEVNKKLALNYWIVNGTNQTEPTNGFKDEMFGFVLTPEQDHQLDHELLLRPGASRCRSDCHLRSGSRAAGPVLRRRSVRRPTASCTSSTAMYWQTTPKLTLQLEGDYVIQRLWANAGPGQSSAPAHTDGRRGLRQVSIHAAGPTSPGRGEYLSDRGGLFSGVTEALKEVTADL